MQYDILKYHLVTTLNDSKERINNVTNEFRKLSNDPEFKVNFYYGLKTTRIDSINIDDSKIIDYNNKKYNELFRKQSKNYNFYYVRKRLGWMGCVSSFLGCINYAKIMNWPYLFVFEDDIRFVDDFNKIINEYLSNINDYKVIILDHREMTDTKNPPHEPINNYFLKIKHYCLGGHAFLINQKYYQNLIDLINK